MGRDRIELVPAPAVCAFSMRFLTTYTGTETVAKRRIKREDRNAATEKSAERDVLFL